MMGRSALEEKTSTGRRTLADLASNSCLLLGVMAVASGVWQVVLERFRPSLECVSTVALWQEQLQAVVFHVSLPALALGAGALTARTTRKGRALLGMALALVAIAVILDGFRCSVSTP